MLRGGGEARKVAQSQTADRQPLRSDFTEKYSITRSKQGFDNSSEDHMLNGRESKPVDKLRNSMQYEPIKPRKNPMLNDLKPNQAELQKK